MASDTARFSHESLQDNKTITELLNAISKGFSKGKITLGEDELTLSTEGLMKVKIKAEREDGNCKLNLRVSWADPDSTSADKPLRKSPPKISS